MTSPGPASVEAFVESLRPSRPAQVFNPWAQHDAGTDLGPQAPRQRRERLTRHLSVGARYVLIGEAAGYQGCKVSGIPFTSERLLLEGAIPRIPANPSRLTSRARPWSEPSATTVWSTLHDLGIADETVLWNAYPWHPFKHGNPHSNRTPAPAERAAGVPVLRSLLALHPRATVLAVGRQSEAALREIGIAAIPLRHPSMGGASRFRAGLAAAIAATCALSGCGDRRTPANADWPVYGGNAAGQRYSHLDQVNTGNVSSLRMAWRFDAGTEGGLQTSPLVVGRQLFGYTTDQSAFALDAATGALLWRFEPPDRSGQPARGMSYWSDGPDARLFVSNANYLYALDPASGRPVAAFGDRGRIDLREGLGRDPQRSAVFLTTPGIVYRDLVIVGFRTSENAPAAPGDIRAYDVGTGRLRWSFHTIPHPGEAGGETWPPDAWKAAGGANNWAGMALDEERGLLFVPTGSPAFDFFGGDRLGDNLYANTLVALDAATGKRAWHFQVVHHDLWDRDLPSPPTLLTITRDGRRIDAVAQTTKQGLVFLFDRVTGRPLFDIEERAVPASTVPGERTAPTQPFPVKPLPFARQGLTEDLLTTRTPEAHEAVLARFRGFHSAGPFAHLNTDRPTIIFPGFDGGAEWGGSAADPQGVLYVNSNDVPWYTQLVPNRVDASAGRGEQVYLSQCAACHRADRSGSPPETPSLVGIGSRRFDYEVGLAILQGKGRMPGFPQMPAGDRTALVGFLMSNGKAEGPVDSGREVMASGPGSAAPYIVSGYNRFTDPEGYPAVVPPWGTLNAIDLNTGEYRWRIPLGEYPELAAQGKANTGTENYGGPLVTAGGLLFIGATVYDRKFRAFDAGSGTLLWEALLPFPGTATPITYGIDGRQYVVIATSGARNRKGPQGAAYVAFALGTGR